MSSVHKGSPTDSLLPGIGDGESLIMLVSAYNGPFLSVLFLDMVFINPYTVLEICMGARRAMKDIGIDIIITGPPVAASSL